MAELDRNLAAAFRKHTAQDKRDQKEGVRTFRNKCFDLLTIYFTIADAKSLAVSRITSNFGRHIPLSVVGRPAGGAQPEVGRAGCKRPLP